MKQILLSMLLLSSLYSQLWINEIDYDQPGTDNGEFIEIAGPAGSYSNVSIELINGNSGSVYDTIELGTITLSNQVNGYGFYTEYFASNGLQNGAPDGAQLSINGSIVDAVAYEGSLNDTAGNPMEEAGEDYQTASEDAQSISRAGLDGSIWAEVAITPGEINANQAINAGGNSSPYANAGSNQSVQPGDMVTLDGSESFDPDGEITSYLWEQSSGPDVILSADNNVVATFTFPDATETTELVFELTVTDDEGASNTDEITVSYISYDELTIAEARDIGVGVEVMISGVVTSPNFQSSGSEYTIQDETAGIVLYGSGITDLNLWLGDEVIVSGVTDEYNGKFEIIISSASDVQILGTGTLPEPQIITVSDLYSNGELYESELITIENVTTDDDWPSDGSSANLTISDGASSTTIMRIDSDTDIDGSQEPIWPLSVTGVGGQYDSSSPYTDGYQLLPRYIADFQGIEGMPVAVAGPDQSVSPGDIVTLDGSASYDSDGEIVAYEWVQISGTAVTLDDEESVTTFFTAPEGNHVIIFRLSIWDAVPNEATDEIRITVTSSDPSTISEIINNCGENMGDFLTCDGQYDLSVESAAECPLYEAQVTTSGTIIDYFDITPFGGPYSFTIQDADANQIDFVVWPESSQYQDGFDILLTDLNVLTQQPFGSYEVQITGELGAYCDDDEMLDINSEWQVTVEYESDITISQAIEGMPVADAGPDQSVSPGDVVYLDGSASYDSNGSIISYEWVQIGGTAVTLDDEEDVTTFFTAPDGNDIIRFSLTIWDDDINESTDEVSITVSSSEPFTISEIINNCGENMGESLTCDGEYNLSDESAAECPLYETLVTTSGTIIDYFDITPFGGPYSFTMQDIDGNQIDFVVWPESSQYQDGFDIILTDLNVLTQEPFGEYDVEITGELGAYCDDDEMLDINSEWQVTVEYESDISIITSNECTADGDVNGDDTLNILDVVQIVNYILGNLEFSDDQICSADMNNDTGLNILDIVQIVNLILQG